MSYIKTTNFGLIAVREEVPSAKDWAAIYWNWINADKILYQSAVNHKHDGTGALNDPPSSPDLTTSDTGGTLLAGKTFYIVLSFVDSMGRETGYSPQGIITTASALTPPSKPTYDSSTDLTATTNALTGGNYWYKLTYVKGGGETTGSNPVAIEVPYDQTYAVTINFDSLNTAANGADSTYVYRKSGIGGNYVKIKEITAGATNSWTDDNTSVADCDKQPPLTNTTNAFNTITIDWSSISLTDVDKVRLYASTENDGSATPQATWDKSSMLIIQQDMGATPTASHTWTGASLQAGKPLVTSQSFPSPSKIDLSTEVSGQVSNTNLPSGFNWQPSVVTFANLPGSGNNNGDVRLVRDKNKLYTWDADSTTPQWIEANAIVGSKINVYNDPTGLPGTAEEEDMAFVLNDGAATPSDIDTWYVYLSGSWDKRTAEGSNPYTKQKLNLTCAAGVTNAFEISVPLSLITKVEINTPQQSTPNVDYDFEIYESASYTNIAYQQQTIDTATYTDKTVWEWFGADEIMYCKIINNSSTNLTDIDITIYYRK